MVMTDKFGPKGKSALESLALNISTSLTSGFYSSSMLTLGCGRHFSAPYRGYWEPKFTPLSFGFDTVMNAFTPGP